MQMNIKAYIDRKFGIQAKITILIFLIMMGFSFVVAHQMSENVKKQTYQITRNYIESIPSLIFNSLYNFMLNGDRQSINRLVQHLEDDNNIMGVHIFNNQWKLTDTLPDLVHKYDKSYIDIIIQNRKEEGFIENTINGTRVMSYYTSIPNAPECHQCHLEEEGQVLGHLNININLTYLSEILERDAVNIKNILVISNIVMFVVLIVLIRFLVVAPVRKIEKAMQEVANSNLDVRLDADFEDEFGRMSRLFNYMVYSLRKSFRTVSSINKSMLHNDRLMTIGTLAAAVSHEIKNPLNSIMLSSDILSVRCKDQKELTERIASDAERIKDIIDNTLNFSRIDDDRHNSIIDLNKFMDDLCHYTDRTLFKWTEIPFITDIGEGLGYINANPVHLEQIFMNILRNASEAVEDNDNPEIRLSARREGGETVISVSDNGAGIPQSTRSMIFNEFYTTKQNGTGIGLYIVKELTDRYKGRISFESEQGKGTVFSIALPTKDTADM
ncbi:signal transduction histidine kinase [Seleniivibrio woodruffii]|uniref:histidine kinase n=2 Tax=Seleniivibrio woodruffii TaxID=1078050 RepID=A0A4R1KAZ8_9BACT|nr:HAMP domain-containing sensor histidine kinase [Seleniivibrio woodruffii]TCK61708.1 signal transduction histidine kinase [Seleniivibrio woodruffii]TVZ35177.1 signal transduction histidine kinase [Seleniivibrio woodruffii]